MELTLHQTLHGFTVTELRPLPEIKATMARMRYEKNGADLIWLDREDDNKSFGIAFKTIPQDDTGVFHILEHSVLCGSDKYPLREPFVDLLKCSLQTFLNAMTYPDKTVYPLSSRNDADFLNLIDVYMDAVLHPLIVHDPHGFRQEGWHYELDSPEGELRRNGVVYNEMKGAYASGDSVLYRELSRALSPDVCYGKDSGGDPAHIPELTYEHYLASYKRWYHPSNSRIFLDGSIDLDAVLGKLDEFLKDFDRLEIDSSIPLQAPVNPPERSRFYEIGADEDPADKVLLGAAWCPGRFDEQADALAATVVSRYLCGSNDAPLKKALLEAELCQDVEMDSDDAQQQMLLLLIRNTSEEKAPKVWETVEAVLRRLAEEGLDHSRLDAILNNAEFRLRERDYGSMPKGLVFGLTMLDSWLYDGDPAQNLDYSASFAKLREGLEQGFFENWIREKLLENPHQARVRLLPSATLGEETRRKEAEEMAALKASWSEEQIKTVIDEFNELRRRQEQPDSEEARAKLPVLKLREIPREGHVTPQEELSVEGRTLLRHPLETNGIDYLELYFDMGDVPAAKLPQLAFLAGVLGKVATEHYSPEELKSQLEGKLGRFDVRLVPVSPKGQRSVARPMLAVSVSALESRREDAVRLIKEVLTASRFDDGKFIYNLLRQRKLMLEQSGMMGGNSMAALRASASLSAGGVIGDAVTGVGQLRWLQDMDRSFSENGEALLGELAELLKRAAVKERVTFSFTGTAENALAKELLDVLPSGSRGMTASYPLLPMRSQGYVIPAQIGFAVKALNLFAMGEKLRGSQQVASQFLTYDYLWNTIRVKGGAYGTGLRVGTDGLVAVTSYRDPSPAASLKSYDACAASLRALAESGESLDRYIISTIGESEPLLTPRTEGMRAAMDWLAGRTGEDRQKQRGEILRTKAKDLLAFAEALDKLAEAPAVCVIGSQDAVDACGLDQVEPLIR